MNNSSAFVCLLHLTAAGAVGDNAPHPRHSQKLHPQLPACRFSGGARLGSVMQGTLQAALSPFILPSPRVNMLRLFLLVKLF